ncbi:GNAT family N-acetyltransferase [Labedella populi]|uniref:GNAT family N-acetyltransferase n=1 Tax=Labedella populi TaxID=2498850 RepID=A0A444QAX0_9MICO|nr:GNAT family N-acetyltransferase [Labedella populi]RWZ61209.1 GNAT family N-acetyltransferase [Labedella populi]
MTEIRQARADDFFPWLTLYEDYATFYHAPITDERAVQTWQWITNGEYGLRAFVVEDPDADAAAGTPSLIALAHVRTIAQPLEGTTALYLDDLYVAESARGRGVASDILAFLRDLARSEGHSGVSWITAADNETAQRVYDRLATRTTWVTYEMSVGPRTHGTHSEHSEHNEPDETAPTGAS